MPRQGDRIADKYLVVGEMGSGGMGVVLAAEHVTLGTRVAVKLLLPQAAASPGAVERFLREARAAAMLRSEHVARVTDVGTLPNGMPYFVMEHLSGRDLRRLLQERGRLPVAEAAEYMLQICEGIAEAHASGVIHRDIKPANLFVTTRPNGAAMLKVLDFGLARIHDPSRAGVPEETVTKTGEVIGSPHYMAPEQFRGLRHSDHRSDLWALGAVLYEMVTGHKPFTGEGLNGVMVAILQDDPVAPRALAPALPEEVEALILRCLEKRPDRRVQWIAEITNVLSSYREAPAAERQRLPSAPDAPAPRPSQPMSHPASAAGIAMAPRGPQSSPGQPSSLEPPRGPQGSAATAPTLPMAPPHAARVVERPAGFDTTGFGQSKTHGIAARPRAAQGRWIIVALSAALVTVCAVVLMVLLRAPPDEPAPSAQEALIPLPSAQEPSSAPVVAVEAPSAAPQADTPIPSAQSTGPAPDDPAPEPSAEPASTGAPQAGGVAGPQKGILNILCQPQAKVVVDSRSHGSSPPMKSVEVKPGNHHVVCTIPGTGQSSRDIAVRAGQTAPVAIKVFTKQDESNDEPRYSNP